MPVAAYHVSGEYSMIKAAAERGWIDAYHADVLQRIGPQLSDSARDWLAGACAPL